MCQHAMRCMAAAAAAPDPRLGPSTPACFHMCTRGQHHVASTIPHTLSSSSCCLKCAMAALRVCVAMPLCAKTIFRRTLCPAVPYRSCIKHVAQCNVQERTSGSERWCCSPAQASSSLMRACRSARCRFNALSCVGKEQQRCGHRISTAQSQACQRERRLGWM